MFYLDPPNWGLIISLSLGLGVSIIGLVVGFIIYNWRIKRRIEKSRTNSYESTIPMHPLTSNLDDSYEDIETFYF